MAKDQSSEFASEEAAELAGGATSMLSPARREWLRPPRGLSALFSTEMWERFSYYGMRAILVLFMTAAITDPNAGMGLQVSVATAIYGLYTFFVYFLALPGAWVADNIWGQRKAGFVGGVLIMLGHVSIDVPSDNA